jgi:hypothetical protein
VIPGRATRIAAGVLGALGFLIKPYFGLAWLLTEGLLASRRGPRSLIRIENLILAIIALAYVGSIPLLAPDYFALAGFLGPIYSTYLAQGRLEAGLLAVGVLIFIAYRAKHGWDPVLGIFELASAGFLAGAAVQLKWWPYHFLPGIVYAMPCLFAGLAGWSRAMAPFERITRAIALTAGLGLLLAGAVQRVGNAVTPDRPQYFSDPATPFVRDWLAAHAAGDTVMIFSSNIHAGFPAVELGGVYWGSRLPSLWPLLALYYDAARPDDLVVLRPPAERTGAEAWLNDIVLEDLERYRPRVLMVLNHDPNARDAGGAARLDYMRYFRADPRFEAILARYRPEAELPRYHVLVRTDGP